MQILWYNQSNYFVNLPHHTGIIVPRNRIERYEKVVFPEEKRVTNHEERD